VGLPCGFLNVEYENWAATMLLPGRMIKSSNWVPSEPGQVATLPNSQSI